MSDQLLFIFVTDVNTSEEVAQTILLLSSDHRKSAQGLWLYEPNCCSPYVTCLRAGWSRVRFVAYPLRFYPSSSPCVEQVRFLYSGYCSLLSRPVNLFSVPLSTRHIRLWESSFQVVCAFACSAWNYSILNDTSLKIYELPEFAFTFDSEDATLSEPPSIFFPLISRLWELQAFDP